MGMKNRNFVFVLILVVSSLATATELANFSNSNIRIKADTETILSYKDSEYDDILPGLQSAVRSFKLLRNFGNCEISAKTNDKKDKIVSKDSILISKSGLRVNYGEKEYIFSLEKLGNKNEVSLICILEIKKSEVLFVDFDNDKSRKKCEDSGGEIIVSVQESMLLDGFTGKAAKLPYVRCTKRTPKISAEDLVKSFADQGLGLVVENAKTSHSPQSSGAPAPKKTPVKKLQ